MASLRKVKIIGAGLAGSEAALQLASRDFEVALVEMRPKVSTPVHHTGDCAELVCSNSLKSTKPSSAAGMLKRELDRLGSLLYRVALRSSVPAGGALAVDREVFSTTISRMVLTHPKISYEVREATDLVVEAQGFDALVLATGPLTGDRLANSLQAILGRDFLSFFDAAAPIVMADSLDYSKVFSQSRYEDGEGDYLNAPFTREEYERFIGELLRAKRTVMHDFETRELFQACQPIEEVARTGSDAPRFGALKPVGLVDPSTGKRPWAAVQLRAENKESTCYNLVGFQTNLTFPEQERVFRMIPGLEHAVFARYGVMHRNTFIDAPRLLDTSLLLPSRVMAALGVPLYVCGQLSGTEGYCEAIRSGLHLALGLAQRAEAADSEAELPRETVFGALLAYACDSKTSNYQPSHVNFGILPPLSEPIRQKDRRYEAYRVRAEDALQHYVDALAERGVAPLSSEEAEALIDDAAHAYRSYHGFA